MQISVNELMRLFSIYLELFLRNKFLKLLDLAIGDILIDVSRSQ